MKWSDEQFQAITKSGEAMVVSAGAGSGKTAVLTERIYTKIVVEKIPLESLIVLTFTNAAAMEMKMRVAKRLSNEKDNELVKAALDYIDQANITTFDAYSLKIVKKYGYLLNLTDDITITDEVILKKLRNEILDDILEERYMTKEFSNLAEKLFLTYDESFKNCIFDIYKNLEYKIDLDEFLNSYIDNYLCDKHYSYMLDSYKNKLNMMKEEIEELYNDFLITASDPVFDNYKEKLRNHIDGENLRFNFPSNKDGLIDGYDEAKALATKIKELYKKYKEYFKTDDEINEIILLSVEDQKELIDIFIKFNDTYNNEKKRLNLFNFSDIAKLSIKILTDYKWVRDEIKYQTREILIDEYQDTSDVQDYFISLIENNNTFYVGDIKQSIYRFRGANPDLFKGKIESVNEHMSLKLSTNYRSRNDVLECVNKIFNRAMSNEYGGAEYTKGHSLNYGFKKYSDMNEEKYEAEIYEYVEKSTSKEISIIASDILKKVNNYMVFDKSKGEYRKAEFKDFVILTRNKTSFEDFLEEFNKRQIPLSVIKDEKFLDGDEVYVVSSLLSYAYDYNINSAHSLLRSFLFEYNDLYGNKELEDLKLRVDRIKEVSKNPYDLLEGLIFEFDLLHKLTKLDNYEFRRLKVYKLLEVSKSIMDIPSSDFNIESYFDFVKTRFDSHSLDIKLSNDNSVKIMTIHASKGLEFPVCYFAELFKKIDDKSKTNIISFNDEFGFILPTSKDGIRKSNPFKKFIIEDNIKSILSEEIRLLYVALTRAREKIIMLIPTPKEGKEEREISSIEDVKTMADIIKLAYNEFKVTKITDINYKSDNNEYKSFVSKNDETALLKEISYKKELVSKSISSHQVEGLVDDEIKDVLKLGIRFHKYLELIDFFDYENSINELELSQKDKNILNKFFKLDLLNGIINTYKEHYFEYEDNNKINIGIIDLILEYNDKVCIVDYKLSDTSKEYYINQLQTYKNYLSKVFDKEIDAYLYSIMKGELTKVCLE